MEMFDDECVLYWNQIWYNFSFSWDLRPNTGCFLSFLGAYKYLVSTATIEADLNHQ